MTTVRKITRIDHSKTVIRPYADDDRKLVARYIEVVNDAIEEAEDSLLLAIDAWFTEAVLDDTEIAIGLFDDDEDDIDVWFTLHFEDNELTLEAEGKDDPDVKWRVPRAHIENVLDDPDDFVDHPSKLDLDWLGEYFD